MDYKAKCKGLYERPFVKGVWTSYHCCIHELGASTDVEYHLSTDDETLQQRDVELEPQFDVGVHREQCFLEQLF
jgi:hypothetical protein